MKTAPAEHSASLAFPAMLVVRLMGLLLFGLALPHATNRIAVWLDVLWKAVHHSDPGVGGYTSVLSRTLTATFSRGSTWYTIAIADLVPLSTLILGLVFAFASVHRRRTLSRRFATWWNASGFVS